MDAFTIYYRMFAHRMYIVEELFRNLFCYVRLALLFFLSNLRRMYILWFYDDAATLIVWCMLVMVLFYFFQLDYCVKITND